MASRSRIVAWRIHGPRSLACHSPQGCKESDTAEATEHAGTQVESTEKHSRSHRELRP